MSRSATQECVQSVGGRPTPKRNCCTPLTPWNDTLRTRLSVLADPTSPRDVRKILWSPLHFCCHEHSDMTQKRRANRAVTASPLDSALARCLAGTDHHASMRVRKLSLSAVVSVSKLWYTRLFRV